MKKVILLHGFASSANSNKANYFRKKFAPISEIDFNTIDFNPTPLDFEYLTITGMIARLRQFILDRELVDIQLIGSSLGSLVGLHYAARYGGVERMLLLAPVLFTFGWWVNEEQRSEWEGKGITKVAHFGFKRELKLSYDLYRDGLQYTKPVSPPAQLLIIHGRQDKTVPVNHSREYAAAYPQAVQLVELDSDHQLNEHLDQIWKYANMFLLA